MEDKLAEIVDYLKSKKVEYGDCRFERQQSESVAVTDNNIDNVTKQIDVGVGIRVVADGSWGFAATSSLKSSDLKNAANKAIKIAKASAITKKESVKLAEQEVYKDHYKTEYEIDPFEVKLADKIELLLKTTNTLMNAKKIKTSEASMTFYKTKKMFYSTEGAEIIQDLIESGAECSVVAYDGKEAQKRSFPNSLGGNYGTKGYEFVKSMDFAGNAERIREEAVQLLSAENCPDTETTVIICGQQMALQVHESCGHPIELDRVLGTEISLAGGSFLTLDKFNKLQYGSEIVNITADATISGALGSFGYDDEGVKAQRTPIIKNGNFVGYLTSRETAPVINQRSNGTMRADGWNNIPLIRMTNINLEPGKWDLENLIADTKQGIFFDLNKSWSIDDKRLNFQFGVEAAWEIKNGKLGKMYKNALYTGITPQFWNSCDAVCNKKYWNVWGIPNCGKGEPMQTAHVAHGAAPTRFRNVKVGVSK